MTILSERIINDRESFSLRLAQLREAKDISARDLSLRLGHNKNYINQIESQKANPTLDSFFKICDYLHTPPKDFFDPQYRNPNDTLPLENLMHRLSPGQYCIMYDLMQELLKKDNLF